MRAKKPLITITCDFGTSHTGVGVMQAVAYGINPSANVVVLNPSVPAFDIRAASRVMEATAWIPKGFHVCVVDPGVGTQRKAIAVETKRGDVLIGPDNGCLISASEFLGGIRRVVEISNKRYMRKPVSAVFHGRDIFVPAAAWLSRGVPLRELGRPLTPEVLVPAPYRNALVSEKKIRAEVIYVNPFGSVFLNILRKDLDSHGYAFGDRIEARFGRKRVSLIYARAFGDVPKGKPLMCPDEYGRVQLSLNQESFSKKHGLSQGRKVIILRSR